MFRSDLLSERLRILSPSLRGNRCAARRSSSRHDADREDTVHVYISACLFFFLLCIVLTLDLVAVRSGHCMCVYVCLYSCVCVCVVMYRYVLDLQSEGVRSYFWIQIWI